MLFQELKSGYLVFLLDKDTMKSERVRVINVGQPYVEPPKLGQASMNMARLVDVTVERDGRSHIYAIPEGAGVTYAGSVVLSTEAEGILREVRALKAASQEVVASQDTHQKRIEMCDAIIAELDTAYREKVEMEGRIGRVETFMQEIKDEIRTLIKELKG